MVDLLVKCKATRWEFHGWGVNRNWLRHLWSRSTVQAGTVWVEDGSWDLGWARSLLWHWSLLGSLLGGWKLVLDGSRLWLNWRLGLGLDHGELESKLQLGLRSAVQLLEDLCVAWVEGDEVSGTVGVALKDDLGIVWNLQKSAKL